MKKILYYGSFFTQWALLAYGGISVIERPFLMIFIMITTVIAVVTSS